MHELFLTALIPSPSSLHALKILQGYCDTHPTHHLTRTLLFTTPRPNTISSLKPQKLPPNPTPAQTAASQAWNELAEILKKQQYVLHADFELSEQEFGEGKGEVKGKGEGRGGLEEKKGTLEWKDMPEPPGVRTWHTRKAIRIRDEMGLVETLLGNGMQYLGEHITESYRCVRKNTTFTLSRVLVWPEGGPGPQKARPDEVVPSKLPSLEEAEVFDGEDKWILTAKVDVLDGSQPLMMSEGVEEVGKVEKELKRLLEWVLVDRRVLNTRVLVTA